MESPKRGLEFVSAFTGKDHLCYEFLLVLPYPVCGLRISVIQQWSPPSSTIMNFLRGSERGVGREVK